ncbi:MAG: glutathione S-transferase family protein [Bdellovibrionales bacterium]|nr:glutathione S-transferase family protein [Bdellovibrionales bacterium]
MLKLYTSPGACAMACDILLEETGVPFERKLVEFDEGYLDSPAFRKLNPNGTVPTLEVEPGLALTEGPAILQWVAFQKPEKSYFPQPVVGGKPNNEYFRAVEWMNFIATELHSRAFGNLWGADYYVADKKSQEGFRNVVTHNLHEKLDIVNKRLEGKTYCMGNNFTAVDAYLFTIVGWAKPMNIDLTPYKNITAFQNRVFERPAVQRAMKANGLI